MGDGIVIGLLDLVRISNAKRAKSLIDSIPDSEECRMSKAIVFYDTKYGITRLVAEKIAEGIKQVGGIETEVQDVEESSPKDALDYDLILLGAPNHIGRPSRKMKKFIDKLSKLDLSGKKAVAFDTYAGKGVDKDFEKAMKKMEKQMAEKIPGLEVISLGLSIRVEGNKGPIANGEIPKCMDFGSRIGSQLG